MSSVSTLAVADPFSCGYPTPNMACTFTSICHQRPTTHCRRLTDDWRTIYRYLPFPEKGRPIPDVGDNHRVCYTNVRVIKYSQRMVLSSSSELHWEKQIELVVVEYRCIMYTFPTGIFCRNALHQPSIQYAHRSLWISFGERRLNLLKYYNMNVHVCINNPPNDALHIFSEPQKPINVREAWPDPVMSYWSQSGGSSVLLKTPSFHQETTNTI